MLAVAAVLIISQIPAIYALYRLFTTNQELMRLLASRNFTEYSVGQARMAKATSEQKKDPSFEAVFEEEN